MADRRRRACGKARRVERLLRDLVDDGVARVSVHDPRARRTSRRSVRRGPAMPAGARGGGASSRARRCKTQIGRFTGRRTESAAPRRRRRRRRSHRLEPIPLSWLQESLTLSPMRKLRSTSRWWSAPKTCWTLQPRAGTSVRSGCLAARPTSREGLSMSASRKSRWRTRALVPIEVWKKVRSPYTKFRSAGASEGQGGRIHAAWHARAVCA